MKPNALIVAALLVVLPTISTSSPKVGGFISRKGNRLGVLGAGFVLGIIGFVAAANHLVSVKAGLYFWAPLWQIVVIQVGYFLWYKFYVRPPVNVDLNWNSGLFGDRVLAITVALLGVLVPAFVIGR